MKGLLHRVLLCAAGFAALPVPAAEVLDTGFAEQGVKTLDFEGMPGTVGVEFGIANCPAANGRQLVVMRDHFSGVLVTRLNFDGSIDTSFGAGGMLRHALQTDASPVVNTAAVCRADGGIWIAARAWISDSDRRIRLIALDAQGQLATGGAFGTTGYFDIPLESHAGGLQPDRNIRGFNQTADGRAFVTGWVASGSGNRSFLIALDAEGALQGVSVFQPPGLTLSIEAVAAGVGPGGGIWVAGFGTGTGNWRNAYRAYLDPGTLQLVHSELFGIAGEHVEVAGGAMVRNGVMVVGATRRPTVTTPARPLLLVMREGGIISALDLPQPQQLAGGIDTGINAEGGTIVPMPGGRVLYAIGAEAWNGTTFDGYKGWYFAQAVIGASAADDRVDAAFGEGGRAVASIASGDASCIGLLNRQKHVRAGVWEGRPTVIGFWSRQCEPEGRQDAVLLRLKPGDRVFGHGFE